MDQVIQLQQQIQRLQQEVNNISQVCNQLQQSEQANALQLQQMTQKEMLAAQGIRRIQQAASHLSQEISQISGITSQLANQVSPMQRTFQTGGTGTFAGFSGQTGINYPQTNLNSNYIQQPGTGVYGGGQYGTFGTSQTGLNQGQSLTNMGQFPGVNMNAFNSQLNPYSQAYSQGGQQGTGSHFGYSSQAFSGSGSNLGSGLQNQGILGSSMMSSNAINPLLQSGNLSMTSPITSQITR